MGNSVVPGCCTRRPGEMISLENAGVGRPNQPAQFDPPLCNNRMERLAADSLREAQERPDPKIAVIGERGVGKSSLINSLRGLRPSDVGAACVGADEVVSEKQLQEGGAFYSDAGLIYHDVPGCRGNIVDVGMDEEYIKQFDLTSADCCVLVYTAVITADLINCACLLREQGVSVCFVRNKLDVDCDNEIEDGNAKTEEEVIAKIRERAYAQLRSSKDLSSYADGKHLFLVSSKYSHAVARKPPKFDFDRLKVALQYSIKNEAKRAQVREIFAKNAKALATFRSNECKALVGSYTLASALYGAIPVPGVSSLSDIAILSAASETFQRIFCLTEAQLDYASLAGVGTYLGLKLATSIPAILAVVSAMSLAADCATFTPGLGVPLSVFLGSTISAAGMFGACTVIIWRLEQVAAKVYDFVLHERSFRDDETAYEVLRRAIESTFPDREPTQEEINNQLYR